MQQNMMPYPACGVPLLNNTPFMPAYEVDVINYNAQQGPPGPAGPPGLPGK